MKPALILPITLLLSAMLSPGMLHAQYNNRNATPDNELYLSDGIVTIEQINGWSGPGGLSGYVSQPSAITGGAFLTYRHFFTRRFALGFTAGLDNESGDLSYGNPEQNATGFDGTSGHYSVHSYTFAAEALFAYIKTPRFMFYGYGGMGATSFDEKYTIYANAPYGSPVPIPSNPYDYHSTYFNAQVTPIGIRFGGNVAGFIEMGFGYKGLLCGGLSARF